MIKEPIEPVFLLTVDKIIPNREQRRIIKEEDKVSTYIIDSSTLVQAIRKADEVEVGNEILVIPKKEEKGK